LGTTYKIYNKLPVKFQNIAISIFGYFWQKRRFGGVFKKEIVHYKSNELFSKNHWKNYVLNELQKMIVHAFDNVPFYKKLYQTHGFSREQVKEISVVDIKLLPFLEKDDLRQFGQTELMAIDYDKNGEYYGSSGSTGTPAKIYFSKKFHQKWSGAFEARVRNWAGVTRFDARGMIGGRRVVPDGNAKAPFYRYNFIEKQVYYSAYHISPTNAQDYVNAMWKHKIVYMTGYAVSNYLLALYIKQQHLKVPQLKAVITSSEKLTPEMRSVLEEVYQCKAYDGWSGVEACGMVTECEYGSLHISEDVGLLEILDEYGNEVAEGESGEVVCTGFLNYDQPLIRYRIGDRMTKGIGGCKCGRQMPLIKEIDGRLEDIVTGPDGRQMVRFHGIFIGMPSIEKAQVIQHSLELIELKIQNTLDLTMDEIELMKQRIKSQLGDINVQVVQHATIEQTANGKYKAVISKLS
jgi:phenylacetate-CoA ligase